MYRKLSIARLSSMVLPGALVFFLLAPGPPAFAQVYVPDQVRQRMWREQAVAMVGPSARSLVETFGDDGCRAIFSCSGPVALQLCALHNSANLVCLPRPSDLLLVIAQPGAGDSVALFIIQHHMELRDICACEAFLVSPLDYSLQLKKLETGAAEVRALKLQAQQQKFYERWIWGGIGIFLLICVIWWWRRWQPYSAAA
jgi:hypothetical protein